MNPVFSKKLSKAERNLVEELRNTRNDWAHQKPFSADDTYRAVDSAERLLRAAGAAHDADALKSLRLEVLEDLRRIEVRYPRADRVRYPGATAC